MSVYIEQLILKAKDTDSSIALMDQILRCKALLVGLTQCHHDSEEVQKRAEAKLSADKSDWRVDKPSV